MSCRKTSFLKVLGESETEATATKKKKERKERKRKIKGESVCVCVTVPWRLPFVTAKSGAVGWLQSDFRPLIICHCCRVFCHTVGASPGRDGDESTVALPTREHSGNEKGEGGRRAIEQIFYYIFSHSLFSPGKGVYGTA